MASRCTWTGFPPRTSRVAYALRRCDVGVRGHTRSGRKQKGPNPCGIRASGIQRAAGASSGAAASRMGAILGLAMIGRLSVRQRARRQRQDAHERTRAGEGFGVAKGDPAVHDDVSGLGSVSTCTARASVSGGASCKGSSLFQATASSVNSLYCLRKGVHATSCCAPSTTLHDAPRAALRCTAPGWRTSEFDELKEKILACAAVGAFPESPSLPDGCRAGTRSNTILSAHNQESPWHLTSPSGR